MNRRDFLALLFGAAVAPEVVTAPVPAPEPVVQQSITDEEFLAIHYPASKPSYALAS